jgi:hypothetical protein
MEKIPVAHQANDQVYAQTTELTNESRILFTDVVDITVNNYGVVMNFMQGATPQSKPSTVARVGMSREHAKSVLEILKVTLQQTDQKLTGLNSKAGEKPADGKKA